MTSSTGKKARVKRRPGRLATKAMKATPRSTTGQLKRSIRASYPSMTPIMRRRRLAAHSLRLTSATAAPKRPKKRPF